MSGFVVDSDRSECGQVNNVAMRTWNLQNVGVLCSDSGGDGAHCCFSLFFVVLIEGKWEGVKYIQVAEQ